MNPEPGFWHMLSGYFQYRKGQRRAVIIMGIVCVACLLAQVFMNLFLNRDNAVSEVSIVAADKLVTRKEKEATAYNNDGDAYRRQSEWREGRKPAYEASLLKPFPFDPNTADSAIWTRLGLKPKTISTILRYRSKGGKFYKPADIHKIYGLKPSEADQLEPYITIANATTQYAETNRPEKVTANALTYKPRSEAFTIDINQSDTSAWISLPGIGSKLANRIVNYRNYLGGFYSIEQVGETYGLHDSVFQKIKPKLKMEQAISGIQKIELNTATADELNKHPYIKKSVANAIIAYRQQHGAFAQVSDIRRIMIVDEGLYNKLLPYLSASQE